MISNIVELPVDGPWVQVSDNQDYFIQNISVVGIASGGVEVLVKASTVIPTDTVGAIVLGNKDCISSVILSGNIWAIRKDSGGVAAGLLSVSK